MTRCRRSSETFAALVGSAAAATASALMFAGLTAAPGGTASLAGEGATDGAETCAGACGIPEPWRGPPASSASIRSSTRMIVCCIVSSTAFVCSPSLRRSRTNSFIVADSSPIPPALVDTSPVAPAIKGIGFAATLSATRLARAAMSNGDPPSSDAEGAATSRCSAIALATSAICCSIPSIRASSTVVASS